MLPVTITWHGHSCFTLENGGRTVVLDPYDPDMIGYPKLSVDAHAMLASHQHGDHNFSAAVRFLPQAEGVLLEAASAADVPDQPDSGVFYCRIVETSHDETGGSKRGKNKVHVISTGGQTFVHLGDLGHVLTPEQAAAIGRPDCLMIPVGGYYTIDAAAAMKVIELLRPVNIVPMHYNPGFSHLPIASAEPFLQLVAAGYKIDHLEGPSCILDGNLRGHCLVFSFQASERR